uniref:Uncharacterized protein n=1 Tax=Aegilops tauschii subsp. strangulata TaxID=200361 RepID=A0A453KFG2_AEGTS
SSGTGAGAPPIPSSLRDHAARSSERAYTVQIASRNLARACMLTLFTHLGAPL